MKQSLKGPGGVLRSFSLLAGLVILGLVGCQNGSAPAAETPGGASPTASAPTTPNDATSPATSPGGSPEAKPKDSKDANAKGEITKSAGPEYLGSWRIQVSEDMRAAAEEQLKKSETSYRNSGLSDEEVKQKMDEARKMIGGVLDGTRLLLSHDATFRLDSGGYGISGRFAASGPQLTLYPDPSTAPSGETAGLTQSGPIELTYDPETKQLRGLQGNAPVVFERAQ